MQPSFPNVGGDDLGLSPALLARYLLVSEDSRWQVGVALPMRKWFGVNASRLSTSQLTSVNRRLLTRDSTSAIAVNNTSSFKT